MTEIKPIFEFLMWDNCNNHCDFCFQREECKNLFKEQKIKSIHKVDDFLDSDKFVKGSHILLVGGEIFDDVSIRDIWQTFLERLTYRMSQNDIDLLYVNTNLLYDNLTIVNDLFYFIDCNNLWDRLKFTTSYDLKGRFHTKDREQLFLDNLKRIKDLYPKCNIVVNTILTNETCEQIINDKFNPKQFCDEYKCDINLIPYIVYTKDLSASCSQIVKALLKTDSLMDGYLKRYYNNLNLPQEKNLYKYNGLKNELEFVSCGNSECGHSENFKKVLDKDICYVCMLKELVSSTGN